MASLKQTKGIGMTTKQIQDLMNETGSAGDTEMYELCEKALSGDENALAEVAAVIEYAAERAAE